ncbi:hypothetical protein FRC0129_01817 [Corynebacterium diphtheriae]|nr:hypothetical protein CIP107549_01803 [Corynebacterium diphtheriae]CAB0757986.1 hypothetical protein FRC0129_01817 [Corynebacterium diphtheriae]
MSNSSVSLTVQSGQSGLTSLLQRAVGLDASSYARLQQVGEAVNVFVTTPFDVIASRRVLGTSSSDGAVLRSADLLATGSGPAVPAGWLGALPPAEGFELVDEIPVAVARQLADQGQALAKQFSSSLGPPVSLLNQTVLTVTGNNTSVDIPMRMIFACTSLGFIPRMNAPERIPRHLRVSQSGRWTRIDAPFGSVYRSEVIGLLFPT